MVEQQLPSSAIEIEDPIINSPFAEPMFHWSFGSGQQPIKVERRRRASYFYRVPEHVGRGRRKLPQPEIFESQKGEEIELELVNVIRDRLRLWRTGSYTGGVPYHGVTRVTRELLEHWHAEGRRQPLFFAQIEAAETIIFIFEASNAYRKGLPGIPRDQPGRKAKTKHSCSLLRYACKMATGTGKTTVMGMLAAWSILNNVASPRDRRFSDTILIVCPNITVRERLSELNPAQRDLSLYRTRQLVPAHRMGDLSRGEVMIVNWHRLAKKESNSVNGVSAKVVKTGEATKVVRNAGKKNERVDIKYFETDAAWFKRIRVEFGSGKGRCAQWLVFNDEAHHAYRRGDTSIVASLEDDRILATKNAREATVWIEGLDRIDRLAGSGQRRGICCCIDLSATPFYIQGSGNEVGKPFPWLVSDFGLLEAIESGLVKIPQLPARDSRGASEAVYFNIWRWVQQQADAAGINGPLTPEIVLNFASAPINILANKWHECFEDWGRQSKKERTHPVPPVFIVVCRDTGVAREIHTWLAYGNDRYGASPTLFKNEPGRESTVRIDSKVIEDIEEGGSRDDTRRLRYILDTLGKTEWPGGKIPGEWSELVRKHNDKVSRQDDRDGSLRWIDERIPPGRDVRCIVSVAMLIEGWDANTVTHIVGLRPFGSQLLCEQVVGRALRRKNYVLNADTQMFAEETAMVLGVPFEIIPFKVSELSQNTVSQTYNHIFSVPEKDKYEITFPIVTGYHSSSEIEVHIDWSKISKVTIDPMMIPAMVELTALTSPDGTNTPFGPGKATKLTLADWRKLFREQQVAFRLAGVICERWGKEHGASAYPMRRLFPKFVFASKRFLAEKLVLMGDSQLCDILHVGEYMQKASGVLFDAIRKGTSSTFSEIAVVPQGDAGRGSTLHVDFWTSKPIAPARKCHLNAMVADTKYWEQTAGFWLDNRDDVVKWVKNEKLGFFIPYRRRGLPAKYYPDFIVVNTAGENVIVEIKGQVTDSADAKAKAAERWVEAVNKLGGHGKWRYLMVTDPNRWEKF